MDHHGWFAMRNQHVSWANHHFEWENQLFLWLITNTTMENHHFEWANQLEMAIFNSYVSLPEGKSSN